MVGVVSVLVLTTMLVTNQPACLNLVTPRPPYSKTRPLIPQLCAPSRKQQSAGVSYSHSRIYLSQLPGGCCYCYNLWESSGKGNNNSKIIKENILVSISIDFTTILKSKLLFHIGHPKYIIYSFFSLITGLNPYSALPLTPLILQQ